MSISTALYSFLQDPAVTGYTTEQVMQALCCLALTSSHNIKPLVGHSKHAQAGHILFLGRTELVSMGGKCFRRSLGYQQWSRIRLCASNHRSGQRNRRKLLTLVVSAPTKCTLCNTVHNATCHASSKLDKLVQKLLSKPLQQS